MLVLSRQERQRIRLGDSIVLTVVGVRGDRVKLGIEAPADLLVLRDELDAYERPGDQPAAETVSTQAVSPQAMPTESTAAQM